MDHGGGRLRAWAARTFGSLRVRNYRLYFTGQMVSLVGTWMQSVAQVWLVLKVSGSALAVGLTAGLQALPLLVVGAWGGVIADRFDKRRILIGTQAAQALLAAMLAVLDVSGAIRLWQVYVLAVALGTVTVVDNPTRQAFVPEMVGPGDVTNAVSLNSATFTAARMVGPALAAVVIATAGLDACFFANAVSFVAVIAALAMMRPSELRALEHASRGKGLVREGIRYAWHTLELRRLLVLAAIVFTFSFNFSVLLPVMAERVFGDGAGAFGSMLSLMGVGSLLGALAMAGLGRPSARLIALAGIGFGAATAIAALAPTLPVELVLLAVVGLTSMIFMAGTNSLLQLTSVDAMRGRVMALYAIVFLGTAPFGGPLTGWLAEVLGGRDTMLVGGLIALAACSVALMTLRRATPERATRRLDVGGEEAREPTTSPAGSLGR